MPDMWWNSSCWHQFTNWWTISHGFGWWNLGEMHDCGWKFHAYCVIPCNDNSLDFEKETLDHLELQGFFMCCMEKWFSYFSLLFITSTTQIYLNNRYCCVCFCFVIKIDSEGCQGQQCYTECSVYQHGPITETEGKEANSATECSIYQQGPVTKREGKEAAHETCSSINFIKTVIHPAQSKYTSKLNLNNKHCHFVWSKNVLWFEIFPFKSIIWGEWFFMSLSTCNIQIWFIMYM